MGVMVLIRVYFNYIRALIMKKNLLLFISLLFAGLSSKAQVSVADSVMPVPLIDMSYAFQVPGGDLAERFGNNSNLGLSVFFKSKNNILYGVGGSFIFSNNVKDTRMINTYLDKDDIPLGLSGLPADIFFYQRGFTLEGKIGKILPLGLNNPNSGLMIIIGAGIMQHNVRIEDDHADIPMLNYKDNKRGYDRMTFGAMTSQFIGYRYMGRSRLINFFFGFELMQGYTKMVRDFQYDIGEINESTRFDALYGIRAGWTLPIYKKAPKEYYFD